MLSGRRLLIGDHHQLPPFESDRLVAILRDHSLVRKVLELAEQFVGSLMRDGELEELSEVAKDQQELKARGVRTLGRTCPPKRVRARTTKRGLCGHCRLVPRERGRFGGHVARAQQCQDWRRSARLPS